MMSTEPGGFVESSDDNLVHFIALDLHAEALRTENDPIIHGENDATVPVARDDELAKGIPGATLHVLAGEGHFANVQVPDKVNPLLASALGTAKDLVPQR
jgi:pimeloyl-ACP methyl ester carboxylesterase